MPILSIPDVPAFADALSPLERAKLGLQDELTVFEIGLLTYPDKKADKERRRLTDFLLDTIKAGQLVADGNPDGWRPTVQFSPEGEAQNKGPFPFAQPHQGTRRTLRGREQLVSGRFGSVRLEEQDWQGDNCLVTWMDYWEFLATPAARGIPKPNWPGCPRQADTVSYEDAKACLGASDADMCAWTLHRGLRPNGGFVAYKRFNGRLSKFDWSEDATLDSPWLDQLAVLRFSRAEVESFQPDPDLRYLTYLEAIERVRKTHPRLPRASIENRLMLVAMAKRGEVNLDLVAIDPLAAKRELNWQTLPECLFRVDQIDELARECGDEQGAAPAPSAPTLPQGEPDRPEQGAATKPETESQMHKRECQEIGKRLWAENPNSTKADIMKHRDMCFYVQAYRGKNTVSGWLAEIDPRPKDKRRGRPKKYPSENTRP